MKALLLSEYKKLELTDLPTPEIGPEDILVQVQACGICGSDIHGWDGSSGRRVPPLVMGHEAAGIVAAVGKDVTGYAEGDRDHVRFDGLVWKMPFLSEWPVKPVRKPHGPGRELWRLSPLRVLRRILSAFPHESAAICPIRCRSKHAALIEAVSVAVHAANRTPVQLGDTAVVVGSGMIGLLVIQAIKQKGCTQVIATDLNPGRLEVAKKLGADATINVGEEDAVARVAELTNGRGADVALEVVGATPTVKSAIDCTRKGGAVTLVGNLAPEVEFPLQSVVTREISVFGSCASAGEYPACVDLLATGRIQVEDMITARAPLEHGHDWFNRLYDGEPDAMKVLLCPTMS